MLGALVRKLLAIAGTALVTRGFLDQDTADGAIPIVAEQVIGFLVVMIATWWSIARAKLSHTRWAAAWRTLWNDPPPPAQDVGSVLPLMLALVLPAAIAIAGLPGSAHAQSPSVGKPITLPGIASGTVIYCDDGSGRTVLCNFTGVASATSTPMAGTSTGAQIAGPFVPQLGRPITVSLAATTWPGGTVQLLRSTDGGTTRLPLTPAGVTLGTYTAQGVDQPWLETEAGATFYLSLPAAGIAYRVAQ